MTLFYVEFKEYSNVSLGGLCSFSLFDIMAIKKQFNSNIVHRNNLNLFFFCLKERLSILIQFSYFCLKESLPLLSKIPPRSSKAVQLMKNP